MTSLCPCGNGHSFSTCCQPIINGKSFAQSAEQLMRSRYTAFVQGNVDYLMQSHHFSTRPVKERANMLRWMNSVKWLGLTILRTESGQLKNDVGYVEFKAYYLEDGRTQIIHERSFFKRESQHWMYVSGVHF